MRSVSTSSSGPLQGKISIFEFDPVGCPGFESEIIFLTSRTVLILQDFKVRF